MSGTRQPNEFPAGDGGKALARATVRAGAATAVLYLVFFFFFDRPVDLWVRAHWGNTWIFSAGTLISGLAGGEYLRLAAALGFIAVAVFDPGLKRAWARNLLFVCLAFAVANVVGEGLKYLFGRCRPVLLFEENRYGFTFFASKWELNSTPSGHTIRAFSILTALALLFRKYRAVFAASAVLIAASRVVVTAHYPADIVLGAFIGTFSALWTHRYFLGKTDGGERV